MKELNQQVLLSADFGDRLPAKRKVGRPGRAKTKGKQQAVRITAWGKTRLNVRPAFSVWFRNIDLPASGPPQVKNGVKDLPARSGRSEEDKRVSGTGSGNTPSERRFSPAFHRIIAPGRFRPRVGPGPASLDHLQTRMPHAQHRKKLIRLNDSIGWVVHWGSRLTRGDCPIHSPRLQISKPCVCALAANPIPSISLVVKPS